MKTITTLLGTVVITLSFADSASAADAAAGAKIFAKNCAACHNNGMNVMSPEKTLKKSALEKNGKYSAQAIVSQVTNGKSPMPAFGNQLSSADIENVAAFVLKRADEDWK